MPSQTRLEGCIRRYSHQIERLATFLSVAQIPMVAAENRVAAEVLLEATTVMAVAHLEEYFNCLVGVAALLQESVVRNYLKELGNSDERRQALTCDAGTISRLATRRVSFASKGKKLEEICGLLFGISPWPTDQAGVLIRDLVRARNVIVHAGGWPDASHAADVETPGLIVEAAGSVNSDPKSSGNSGTTGGRRRR
jgi:hypothetical protein